MALDITSCGNYTIIPNEVLNFICEFKPSSTEIAVFFYVYKKCFFGAKLHAKKLSISCIARDIQCGRERVQRSIKTWERHGFFRLVRSDVQCGLTEFQILIPTVDDIYTGHTLGAALNVGAGGAHDVGAGAAHDVGAGAAHNVRPVETLKGFTGGLPELPNNLLNNYVNNSSISGVPKTVVNFIENKVKSKKYKLANYQEIRALINRYGVDVLIYAMESYSKEYLLDQVKCPHKLASVMAINLEHNYKSYRAEIDMIEIGLESNARSLHAKLKQLKIKGQKNFVPTSREIEFFEKVPSFFGYGESKEPRDLIEQAVRHKVESYAENITNHYLNSVHESFGLIMAN